MPTISESLFLTSRQRLSNPHQSVLEGTQHLYLISFSMIATKGECFSFCVRGSDAYPPLPVYAISVLVS